MRTNVTRGLAASLGVAVIAALGVTSAGAQNPAPNCVKKNNVQAIVDDSGSMAGTDSQRLRGKAIGLFIDQPANQGKTLGATEFGSTAVALFNPGNIAAQGAAMKSATAAGINADNGGTNYNDAFAQAGAQNPGATARIFLTDGEPTSTYANGHVGGPPTYVIGFSGALSPENNARLQAIATDTGGQYFPQVDSSQLQSTIVDITNALDCTSPTKTQRTVLDFTAPNQVRRLSTAVSSLTKSVVVNLSWPNSGDKFDLTGQVTIRSRGRTIGRGTIPVSNTGPNEVPRLVKATGAARKIKVKRLKITRRPGDTYTSLTIKNVKRGTLRFSVKATALSTPTKVVSQITQREVR